MRRSLRLALAAAATGAVSATSVLVFGSSTASAAAFSPSDFVVYQVGTGSALTNSAAPVALLTFASDVSNGTAKATVALPTTTTGAQHRLTATGLSRSEGQLSLSPDRSLLAFTGYDAAVGQTGPTEQYQDVNGKTVNVTGSLTASDPKTVARVVGLLDGTGATDTSTAVTGASVPQVVRAATTVDGQTLWLAGSDGGVLATSRGGTTATTALTAAGLDATSVAVAGGQLFAAGGYDGQPATRLTTIGTGTPTTGATVNGLPGLPSGLLPDGFVLLDLTSAGFAGTGLDTLYAVNAAEKGGAVDKYSFDGTSWSKQGSVGLDGVHGLAATTTGRQVLLAATTPTGLYTFGEADGSAGGFTSAAPSKIASPVAGAEFRGIAPAPTGDALSKPSLTITGPAAAGQHISYLTGSVVVKGTATAHRGISSVTVAVDKAAAAATTLSGTGWSRTISLSGLSVGGHTLTIRGYETSSGASTTVTRTFVRDGVPAGAIGPGAASFLGAKVARSPGWRAVTYHTSPDHRGVFTTGTSYVNVTSYGRSLDLHFQRRPDAGEVRITIDGKAIVLDLRYATASDLVKRYRGLSAGKHRVRIQALHVHSTGSRGYVVLLGFLRVYA